MCKFCSGTGQVLYQTGVYGNLYIDNLGKKKILLVEPKICPPFANCIHRDTRIQIAYEINYCPNCGGKMEEQE